MQISLKKSAVIVKKKTGPLDSSVKGWNRPY